ncbi:MAG: TlpA family protein disulfide reductase [Ruminococcaceae bacterium]|nr:TlpA family protein disulfide reductase [Oscillospiraceae bacterium]
MKNKKTLIILSAAFAVIIAAAGFAYGKLSEKSGMQNNLASTVEEESAKDNEDIPKVEMTDFTVTDIDGNSVNFFDFEGKPVIINFWASWCGPCQMEMPDFEEKYLEYGDKIHFMMINVTDGSRETVDTAKKLIAEKEYTFPVYFDTQLEASNIYGIYSLPTTLFVDAQGYGIAQATGMISGELLQKGIDMIYQAE